MDYPEEEMLNLYKEKIRAMRNLNYARASVCCRESTSRLSEDRLDELFAKACEQELSRGCFLPRCVWAGTSHYMDCGGCQYALSRMDR